MSNVIPKSLHTVRVLTVMALMLDRSGFGGGSPEQSVDEAARLLGYGETDDDYGLKAKAVKQLESS